MTERKLFISSIALLLCGSLVACGTQSSGGGHIPYQATSEAEITDKQEGLDEDSVDYFKRIYKYDENGRLYEKEYNTSLTGTNMFHAGTDTYTY